MPAPPLDAIHAAGATMPDPLRARLRLQCERGTGRWRVCDPPTRETIHVAGRALIYATKADARQALAALRGTAKEDRDTLTKARRVA